MKKFRTNLKIMKDRLMMNYAKFCQILKITNAGTLLLKNKITNFYIVFGVPDCLFGTLQNT